MGPGHHLAVVDFVDAPWRRFARRVRLWVLGFSFLAIGKIVIDEESKRAKERMRIC